MKNANVTMRQQLSNIPLDEIDDVYDDMQEKGWNIAFLSLVCPFYEQEEDDREARGSKTVCGREIVLP
jgi:hypothetical protein